ncbi:PaaI family thioesterase [Paraburkholderia sp. J63]|uniref:PaaI family thioesterase n=1 Tax=Paraburkholderia sp. J63 TaxID=2805434 RepID=UPI002ABDE7A4|nr:PaaI family thioesterase [Paraburkholderia sp. J63]
MAEVADFMRPFGPLYYDAARRILGLRVGRQHLNLLGITHGGMLASLADHALGFIMMRSGEGLAPGVTASLNLEFLGSGRPGDRIEAHVTLDKMGARLRFGSCRLTVDGRCLVKASGVFAVLPERRKTT